MFFSSPFELPQAKQIQIPPGTQIVVVADMFADEYVGGAELTTQALIEASPMRVFRLHAKELTLELLQQGKKLHWIFGNFSTLDMRLIPTIIANMSYSVLEYDYKYCKYRSPEKHAAAEKLPCDCHNQMHGKLISAFFYGARTIWWMSEAQQERYTMFFPFLSERDQVVLSSVFSEQTLTFIKQLRNDAHARGIERHGWITLGSDSWIKGASAAKEWCTENGKEATTLWNVSYDEMLRSMVRAEGVVYLPPGGDTCPRFVIEAKLLGCQLKINSNVQHASESWFATDDVESIEDYLANAPSIFWNGIKCAMEYSPKISGYTTTLNCKEQEYPYVQCIESMLVFCDQVVIVDGGSTDGTWESLQELERNNPAKILAVQRVRDWSNPRFAVFDGAQKAEARKLCTSEFCWQMDVDEVVHEDDAPKIIELAKSLPRGIEIVTLPVIEYWGGPDKVRPDVQPWKWRLSRNKPHITHGIPAALRRYTESGELYAAPGTDGCDMIDAVTGNPVECVSFYTAEIEHIRGWAADGTPAALAQYEKWFNEVTAALPSVFHYSWYDLERKIKLYRRYWTAHWKSLYNQPMQDTAESNMMFDAPWADVTPSMIRDRAELMREKLGGWIWHKKWDGKTTTPHIKCSRSQPAVMQTISKNVNGESTVAVLGITTEAGVN